MISYSPTFKFQMGPRCHGPARLDKPERTFERHLSYAASAVTVVEADEQPNLNVQQARESQGPRQSVRPGPGAVGGTARSSVVIDDSGSS